MVSDAPVAARKRAVLAGRLLLALLLLLGWELGARTLGSVFFAPPLDVAARIVDARPERASSPTDVASTLARLRARLRHRLRRRRAAAVPAAPLAAGERGGRALHHGLDGHSQIRAGAVADSLVRHRRPAQAGGGDADGVLHHLHHHLRGHPRRRSAPDQHGAHCRRQRDARSRARSSGNRYCRSSSQA